MPLLRQVIEYRFTLLLNWAQSQQHEIEIQIETQKGHRKHYENRLRELQNLIKKAEKEHENMKRLVQVRFPILKPTYLSLYLAWYDDWRHCFYLSCWI